MFKVYTPTQKEVGFFVRNNLVPSADDVAKAVFLAVGYSIVAVLVMAL